MATTVAKECILGRIDYGREPRSLSWGIFLSKRSPHLDPDYQPKTVNTDGWGHQEAWKTLFPGITLLLCFLHSVLKITDRCKRSR